MRFLLLVISLVGWSYSALAQEMTVDGTSKETYEQSIKAMADGLSAEDREAFGRGLINLIVTRYPPAQGAQGLAMIQFMEPAVAAAHITLDGVSREEILAKGREIVASDANETASDSAPNPADAIRSCLQGKIVITSAKIESASYGRNISMDVTNNLSWAISGIRVEYIAMSEGRSVPWAQDDFSLSISGGIEPGETRTVATSASLFPSDAPEELIVSVQVLDVADPLQRQLIKDVTVIGWADDKSAMACQ